MEKERPDANEDNLIEGKEGISRRKFIVAAAAGTAVGAGIILGLPGCQPGGEEEGDEKKETEGGEKGEKTEGLSNEVAPGKLDDYYGFWSGGQSGEIRVMGVPSMREIKRIPVFNYDSATGHGTTDASKKILSGVISGDTHHVHGSYEDGTYDGKYLYTNDKLNSRIARIRLDYMELDKVTQLPNVQGHHGIFPMRTRVEGMPYYVFCNAEFRVPMPNDGRDLEDPKKYGSMHTAVDGDTMEVKWQVRVSGNLDLAATDYQGRFSMANCYDSEEATNLAGFMEKDTDWAVYFNIKAIEEGLKAKDYTTVGSSPVPVLDGRKGTPGEGKYTLYVPVPKSPHGINVDPTGKYSVSAGKLSPTATVIELDKVEEAFAGKIKPEECVVAQPELGLGPLHTAFDNKGNAYTSLFLDSQMVKWNLEKAIKQYGGEKVNPIEDKIDVHYQVGHTNASMSETKDADGQWLISLNKFSKDRFLPVGPRHPDNDQLIDMTGEKLRLVHDGPVHPEPHDCIIVKRDLINPKKVYDPEDPMFDDYKKMAQADGVALGKDNKVVRSGTNVKVYMTSIAPTFGLTEFKVKKGDTVQVILTNVDTVEDLSHAFSMCNHGVQFGVHPGQTQSATFVADKAGVYWYYCNWFCHALHLEMRGRMIVEA